MNAHEQADLDAYKALKGRWDGVKAWAATPAAQPWSALLTQETGFWDDFSKRWEQNRGYLFDSIDDHEHGELAQMVFRFGAVEEKAKTKGYKPADETPIKVEDRGPDFLDKLGGSIWKKTEHFDPKTGNVLSEEQSGLIGEAAKKVPGVSDPYLAVKVGALGALAVGTVAGALAVNHDSTKVVVAAGGSVVTLAAALAMFWPSKKKT